MLFYRVLLKDKKKLFSISLKSKSKCPNRLDHAEICINRKENKEFIKTKIRILKYLENFLIIWFRNEKDEIFKNWFNFLQDFKFKIL